MKTIKFSTDITKLVKSGKKTTTWRLFDDKNLTQGEEVVLATREADKITEFGKALITSIDKRTISTLQSQDYIGHEPVQNPLIEERIYYGDRVNSDTEVKVIKFKILELY